MTKIVINKIKYELENKQTNVDCFAIENTELHDIKFTEYEAIGFAYPVHSFNAPKLVIDFVNCLPNVNAIDTFIISTAGENNPINYASSHLLIKRLHKKGFKIFYDKQFTMPSNFVVKHSNHQVKQRIDEMDRDVPSTVDDLINQNRYMQNSNPMINILAFVGRIEWLGAHILGKFFHAKKGCNHCGKCVKNCPNKNITMSNNTVHFKWHCGLCMRCIYQCPKQVIDIYQPFKFLRLDRWYDFKQID